MLLINFSIKLVVRILKEILMAELSRLRCWDWFRSILHQENNRFLNIDVSAEYIDDDADFQNTELGVEADYYFDRSVNVGAGMVLNSGDNISDEGRTYLVQVKAFISPKTSVGFEYEKFTVDDFEIPSVEILLLSNLIKVTDFGLL